MTQMTDFSYNVYTVGHVLYVYTLYTTIRQIKYFKSVFYKVHRGQICT